METIYKHILFTLILSLFLSCQDTIDSIDSFSFEVTITGAKEAFVTDTILNELVIKPINIVDDTRFSFSYNSYGKGYYKIDDSKVLENETYNLASDVSTRTMEYVPLKEGEHEVEIIVTNNKEHSTTIKTYYTILKEITDFEFSFIPSNKSIAVGESTNVNINFEQTTDEFLSYSLTISSSNDGQINWGGYEKLPYTIDNIDQTNFTIAYIPTEVTEQNNFTITVKASNGVRKTETFEGIEVTPIEFDFTLSKTVINATEDQYNDLISITLNRPSTYTTGLIYEPNYYMIATTSTNDILIDNGRIPFGRNIALEDFTGITGETFTYSLIYGHTVIGGDITFTVFNDTGYKVSKTVKVNVIE
ncbi:hypothetical protein [Cellulophaga sp. Ld12]|uniref:hypothetical protein n=1 Tax=Cellulophaga sp. Ld12 TaxID=3229535 RepID=UPI003863EC40